MSIKIYNGLRSTEPDPFVAAQNIRDVLEPIFFEQFFKFEKELSAQGAKIRQVLADDHDYLCILDDDQRKRIFDTLPRHMNNVFDLWFIMAGLNEVPEHTFSPLDMFYRICLLQNQAGGNPLVLVFGEHHAAYRNALLDAGVVQDYGYWDNTDEPEDVDEQEWEERKRAWGLIMTKSPDAAGLYIDNPNRTETLLFQMRQKVSWMK